MPEEEGPLPGAPRHTGWMIQRPRIESNRTGGGKCQGNDC